MSCILGRRALGALAVWFFIVAAALPGHSHVSAQAKAGCRPWAYNAATINILQIPITGLPDKMIWTVAFDSEDRPWVGTNHGGATQQDDGTWRWLTTADGLAGEAVKAYLFPVDGSMWVGTDRAIDVFATPDTRREERRIYLERWPRR